MTPDETSARQPSSRADQGNSIAPVVVLSGVSKVYPGSGRLRPVLDCLNCEIPAREIVSIIGRNGVGKTTLARILAGVDDPTAGQVFRQSPSSGGLHAALAHQETDTSLLPWLTNERNIALGFQARGVARQESLRRVHEFADQFRLPVPLEIRTWASSGGQRQMVAVARAAVLAPALLVLDEPFSRIDPANVWLWRRFLLEYASVRDTAIVIITHSLDDALYTSDRIHVLSKPQSAVGASFTKSFHIPVPRQSRAEWRHDPSYSHLRAAVADELDAS